MAPCIALNLIAASAMRRPLGEQRAGSCRREGARRACKAALQIRRGRLTSTA